MWKLISKKISNQEKITIRNQRSNARIYISKCIQEKLGKKSQQWCRLYLNDHQLLIQFLEKKEDENARKVYRGKISLPKFVLEKYWEGEEGTKSVDWQLDSGNIIVDLRSLRY